MIATTLFRLGMTLAPWLPRSLAYAAARAFATLLAALAPTGLPRGCGKPGGCPRPPGCRPRRARSGPWCAHAPGAELRRPLAAWAAAGCHPAPTYRGGRATSISGRPTRPDVACSSSAVISATSTWWAKCWPCVGTAPWFPSSRIRPPRLFQYVSALRARYGLTLVPAEAALRPALRTLRRGGIVVLINDWDRPGNGVPVRFFDRETRLPAAPAVLHLRTGAPIVPCFVQRRPGGRYAAWAEPPIHVAATGGTEQRILAIMQSVAASLEAAIRRDPTQWVLFHPVWPPPATRSAYRDQRIAAQPARSERIATAPGTRRRTLLAGRGGRPVCPGNPAAGRGGSSPLITAA